jgi:hypothetical protein
MCPAPRAIFRNLQVPPRTPEAVPFAREWGQGSLLVGASSPTLASPNTAWYQTHF